MKQFLGMVLCGIFFSGCSGEEGKASLFIPKDNTLSASVFGDESLLKTNDTSLLKKEKSDFFLIAQKLSPDENREFRLYSNDENSCARTRGENTNLCIFEVWEKEKVFDENGKRGDLRKIFFFEETESGQFFEYYAGEPIAWKDQETIIFEDIYEKKSGIKHIFSAFNPETQEQISLYQIAFWKDWTTQELDGFISLTQNGTQYFFDPVSYDNAFRAYRVIDPAQPFYVKSSGLENLVFIDQIPEKNIQKVEWEEDFSGILFRVVFQDDLGDEQEKIYEFSGGKGFVVPETSR